MSSDDLTRAHWRKSTRSNGAGACVEVAQVQTVTGLRDSKDKAGPVLSVDHGAWYAFVGGVKAGEFDL